VNPHPLVSLKNRALLALRVSVLLSFLGLLSLRAVTAPDAPFTAQELAQGYTEDSLLAAPRAAYRATADAAEAREGRRLIRKFTRFDDLRVLSPAPGETAAQAITRLRATGRYEFVEPDYLLHSDATPNDANLSAQWSLSNGGASNGIVGADISALAAWDTRNDASSVIVAVIDSGARLTHGDLAPNLWRNPAPTIGDLNGIRATGSRGTITSGDPTDDNGHGTHVAGIIGAVGNNGSAGGGLTGVAWKVQLMPLKFLTSSGSGATSDAVACIDYAIAHGAAIINASYGESGGNFSQAQYLAIKRARDAGIIFVAAAGNDAANLDVSPHYPASYPLDNVLAIGATGRRDDLATYSNFGAAVELFAPGSEILSTAYTGDTASIVYSGTSMAAPHVSGALALLKAQFPADTPRQLINRLLRSVDPLAVLAGKSQTRGRLNLAHALTSTDNRPFNDDFASRAILSNDNITARAANAGATRETDEPAPAGIAGGGGSLWWQWTSTTGGFVTIGTTADSTYDTVLAVYTGTSLSALTPIASNDNAPGGTGTNSRVTFTAQPGVAYQIAIEGKNGATGLAILDISTIPANDAFATPVDLTGLSATLAATNKGASREPGEPQILANAGGTSLWYRWTAPQSGRFQLAITSIDVDPIAAVYTGTSLSALTLIAANDDDRADHADTSSLVTFNAVAGTTYRFAVDAKTGFGQFTLTLNDTLWQAAATDSITPSPTVASDGTIYAGSADKYLYAFNPDGTQKWSYATTGSLDSASAAVSSDGIVYVGSNDSLVYAIKPDGTLLWSKSIDPTSPGASNSIALAADGTLYLKATDGYVYALNPADGSRKWRSFINGADASHYGSPSIGADGTVYCGSSNSSLYALNPTDGTKVWTFAPATADGGIYSPPAIDTAGNLYFTTLTGAIYSVTSTGTQRWRYASGGNCTSSPALSADGATLYYGGYDKQLYALATASGALRWTSPLGDEVRASSPAVDASGVIYIGCYDKKLYAINPDGSLKRTWATGGFIRSSPAIAGTTLYVGSNDHKLYAINLGVSSAGGPWPQYRANARRLGRAVSDVLVINKSPLSQTVTLGYPFTLSVTANNAGTYQWFKNGVALVGATGATYTGATATAASAGNYTVVVTGNAGSVTSAAAIVTVAAPDFGRLINLSVRTGAGSGARTLIVGFTVSGANKPVLIRGIGPGLTPFGVTGVLADPKLELFNSASASIATNDNWDGALGTVFTAVGAFGLPAASKDAALATTLGTAGSFTAQITGVGGTTGIALAELYDADPAPPNAQSFAAVTRLINVSARAQVDTGGGILIAGFVISGNVPKTVLIRAIGPSLTQFSVPGVLADPRLDLYRGDTRIQSNDNWDGTVALAAAFASVGAFPLSPATSKDAALLVTLPPGSYTAQVSGVGNTTGVALIEIYEVP
jgi:outer membrane protein assembly factor BamB/subtilisin family serine protease